MPAATTPGLEGQIRGPNPFELFWEKNRRIIFFGVAAAAVAVAINYATKYYKQREADRLWSGFASIGLDRGYVRPGMLWDFYESQRDRNPQAWGWYFSSTVEELLTRLPEDLESANPEGLAAQLDAARGTPAEPLLLWVSACRDFELRRWEAAEDRLSRLSGEFPAHFLCRESPYPVQWREEVEKSKESRQENSASPGDGTKKLEIVPPIPASPVRLLTEQIKRQRAFEAANPRFYEPAVPDSSETAVLELVAGDRPLGTIKFRFFASHAPKHVKRFFELAGTGFWDGQRVHEIARAPTERNRFSQDEQNEFRFGLPTSREANVENWTPAEIAAENIVDWEASPLSHFPGSVAVESHTEGRSQVERVVINGQDVAGSNDGTRVVIGKVTEGLEVVKELIDQTLFLSELEARAGRGKPNERITIKSLRIE